MSFKLKLFFTFVLFGIFLSFFSVYSFSQVAKDNQLKKELEHASSLLIEKEKMISSFIDGLDTHIYSIANNKVFQKFTKDRINLEYVHELFKSVAILNHSISQVRYIDNNGKEIVRVGNFNSQVKIVATNELQDKSKRYYFKEIKNQPLNTIWHSRFELNIENNKIEMPLNPIIRIGLNIDSGIIIINVSLAPIINHLKNNYHNILLVDQDGEVIIDSHNKHSWSAYLDKKFDLEKFLNYELASFLTYDSFKHKNFISIKIKEKNLDNAVLILKYPENLLSVIDKRMFYTYIMLFISALVLAIILAFLFSKPISNLSDKIEKLNDELDKKVEQRTHELNDSLNIIDKYVIRSITDKDGIILDVSDAFCKVSQYKREELIGESHSLVRHPDTPTKVFTDLWNTITRGRRWEGKIKNLAKDGSSYWVKAYIEPNFDKYGNIISYTAIRNNITSKVLLEVQIDKNNAIIRFASSGIGTMDLEGNFLSINSYYTKLFGYQPEELIGKNCLDITTDDYKLIAKQSIDTANKTGVVSQVEKVCLDKSGNEINIEMSLNMLPDKKSFVVVINSLEDRKKLEALNKSLGKRVDEEVQKNTEQLEFIQKEQLKTAKLSSIATMAAGITHEINTPLTYIKGNLEMLKDDIIDLPKDINNTNMIEDTDKIFDGINRIANIVEAMKEVSQTSTELKVVENIYTTLVISLTVIFNRSKQVSKIYLNDKLFDIYQDKNELVFNANVQKQRLEQVWIVIVNNALDELIKINDYEERKLDIYIKEESKYIVISFKDNAGGINEDIIDKIFDPFVSTKEHSGIGIGLNIAKKIINEQGGDIIAYNDGNHAIFEVKIPL